ncbi:MAG: GntR family transcriptional regulator, partial [Rhodoferax sp.]|nr:GntR family transcriptional regulator [Rhodoferax sp.]
MLPSTALQSIGAHLASVLRERIVTGVYAPGEWIRESLLAQEFGYSNGPIREALQLLVGEGLLVRATWRGVRVVELSGREIVEIFQ